MILLVFLADLLDVSPGRNYLIYNPSAFFNGHVRCRVYLRLPYFHLMAYCVPVIQWDVQLIDSQQRLVDAVSSFFSLKNPLRGHYINFECSYELRWEGKKWFILPISVCLIEPQLHNLQGCSEDWILNFDGTRPGLVCNGEERER